MRRDKKKDLILDFTSLLDVVMLLLFFFILYSRIDVNKAETAADNAKAEAAIEIAQMEARAQKVIDDAERSKTRYDDLIEENRVLQERLEHDIEIVTQITPEEANEIIAFNSSSNLKLILTEGSNADLPMMLKVVLNKEVIGECVVTEDEDNEDYQTNDITLERLINWISENGIKKDSVVMCDFVYKSSDARSSEAFEKITGILESLHGDYGYSHFYYSSTNISIRTRKNNNRQEKINNNE